MEHDQQEKVGQLVVTARGPFTVRKTRAAIRRAIRGAKITGSGFRSVLLLNAEGDPLQLAKELYEHCGEKIGHATAVLAEVESKSHSIKEAATRIAAEQIAPSQSFCFRLNKRGTHNLPDDTPKIEREIGGAIYEAIEQQNRTKPLVALTDPDVTIIAEVLGPSTLVGVFRKDWRTPPTTSDHKAEVVSHPLIETVGT